VAAVQAGIHHVTAIGVDACIGGTEDAWEPVVAADDERAAIFACVDVGV
jgi:hypothetical protein